MKVENVYAIYPSFFDMQVIALYGSDPYTVELNALLRSNSTIDINSDMVKNTDFYKEMQTAQVLLASSLDSSMSNATGINLLIAQIAATSPTLKVVDFRDSMRTNGVEIASALAKSHSIEEVVMCYNNFGDIGKNVAAALAQSTSIKSVNFSQNDLNMHTPEVAEALTISSSITKVKMSYNCHDFQGAVTNQAALDETIAVFTKHNQSLTDFAEVKNAGILSDSLPNPLIDLVGEYFSLNHIEFLV